MKIVVVSLNKKFDNLKPKIKKAAAKLARLLKIRNAYLEIYLTNKTYGTHKTYNVLAFPPPKNFPRPDAGGLKNLGEIYLNPARKSYKNFMLIHGFLHLLGYDHKEKNDRIKMEKQEAKLLAQLPAR